MFFLVKKSFSGITHAALGELFSSNSSVASQSYTYDAFVQPLTTVFLRVELIEDSLTFEAHRRVGEILFPVHMNRVNFPPSPFWIKKSMTMKKCFCLFSLLDLSTRQDQILKSYWIYISFLLAKLQATAYKENHVFREHEMQKVRHR